MNRQCLFFLALAAILAVPMAAPAADLDIAANGQLLGARNVVLNGIYYDVEFAEGTCAEVFGACDLASFDFQNQDSAGLAAQALLDQVFLDLAPGQEFDSEPELTSGCGNIALCKALTPYAVNSVAVTTYRAMNWEDYDQCLIDWPPGPCNDVASTGTWNLTSSTYAPTDDNAVWARWTPSETPLQNLVMNGSFESGWVDWQFDLQSMSGVVTDRPEFAWDASSYLGFGAGNAWPTGSLEQTITVTPGQMYLLSFHYGKFGAGDGDAALQVSVTGASVRLDETVRDETPSHTSGSPSPMDLYNPASFAFLADANTVTLRFEDVSTNDGYNFDLYLDAVAVSPIPPPRPDLVVDGSFELFGVPWQFDLQTISGSGIVTNPDSASDGYNYLGLGGGNNWPTGAIRQTLYTVPGQRYELSFHFGHFGGGAGDAAFDVRVTGRKPLLRKTVHDTTPALTGIYNDVEFEFVADAFVTVLGFSDVSTNSGVAFDLYLDSVSVVPIEPSQNEQVVTIYFAGTGMTSAMWNWAGVPFPGPETVARLYHFHLNGENHRAWFVEGPDSLHPNWIGRYNVAINYVDIALLDWDEITTLNLVGFSRGGVSTIHAAHKLRNDTLRSPRIKKINILAFDPVPGETVVMGSSERIEAETMNLPADVEYYGFYSEDERSYRFGPVFPVGIHTNFYKVRGSHETMVGNTRADGHRGSSTNPALENMSRALWKLAAELLGSSDWGHVRFLPSDLHWYDGQTDLADLENTLVDNSLALAWTAALSDVYYDMRLGSFVIPIGNREAWWDDFWVGDGCHDGVLGGNISDDHAQEGLRCVYYRPNGYAGELGNFEDDYDASLGGVPEARWLNTIDSNDSYLIWNRVVANGSLDVDGDFVDYSEDNCPMTANTDQADTDIDGFGDVCDNDNDNDGVPDSVDNCTMRANASQLDTDGDGHGNICDGDFDDNCVVNAGDLGILRTLFFQPGNQADLDGNAITNATDLGIFRTLFFMPPGPSAAGICTPN